MLVIVGALNWPPVGAFEFDLVAAISGSVFGEASTFSRIIYILVGISSIIQLANLGAILN
jgi:uncharacterized membrane protein YuzA (DUF378 family)